MSSHQDTDAHRDACKSTSRLLGAQVDGELDAVKTLDVEDHLAACETCRERMALDRAIRGSLKKAVRTTAPDEMKARLMAAMAGARAREAKRDAEIEDSPRAVSASTPTSTNTRRPTMLRHWRTMIPLASAAAVALAWGAASKQPLASTPSSESNAGIDLLNQFVDVHRSRMRPETPDPKEVRQFEREVGVRVHVPQLQQNARFVGGRLLPVQGGESAAMLQYEVRQGASVQRVSVFIYDPNKVKIGDPNLSPRAIGTAEVRVGQTRGYTVAIRQGADGVGYAVASDLDPDSSASIVAAADRE